MADRPPKLPGIPWLVPHLVVRDVAAAVEFYTKAFGFEKKIVTEGADGKANHGEMKWKDCLIMMGLESQRTRAPVSLGGTIHLTHYVYVEDVDALHQRAVGAGANSVAAPKDEFWGDRVCLLVDPDGHNWMFATNVKDPEPSPTARPPAAPTTPA